MLSLWDENRQLKRDLEQANKRLAMLEGTDRYYLLLEMEEYVRFLQKMNRIYKRDSENAKVRRDDWERRYHAKVSEYKIQAEQLRREKEERKRAEFYASVVEADTDRYKSYLADRDRRIEELLTQVRKLEKIRDDFERYKKEHKAEQNRRIKELEEYKAALEKEVAKLTAILDNDARNSGIPTSKTPINKNKNIPNSRVNTGRTRGGQAGHKKHSMEKVTEDRIDDHITHAPDECPECGGKLLKLGTDDKTKDVVDMIVTVKRVRNHFPMCQCKECGKKMRAKIPDEMKEDTQYGPEVQAFILSQLDEGYVSINRTADSIKGFTEGEIALSEGFIAKVQKRAACGLDSFIRDVEMNCRRRSLLYWDDTVVFINKTRGCMRFYGDEYIALYRAHEKKNKQGLDEDAILSVLRETSTVMHDHNMVNYNPEYIFKNAECMAHLERDIQKAIEQLDHKSAKQIKKLIQKMIKKRKLLIRQDKEGFEDQELRQFEEKLEEIITRWREENSRDRSKYYGNEEFTLIHRIMDYKDSYFLWMYDFRVPVTNNLSERSLRMIKSKMKISGQFQNIETARYFANIKTYTETCKRNGILPYEALKRLMEGKPYTLQEVLRIGEEKQKQGNRKKAA